MMRSYRTGHFEIRSRTLQSGKVKDFAYGYVLSEFPNPSGNRRHYATGKTKKEAEQRAKAKAAKHDAECRARLDPEFGIPTLDDFVAEWISTKTLTAASSKKYRNHRKHLCEFAYHENDIPLGQLRVDRITFQMLERCYLAFCSTHRGKSLANFRDIISEIFQRLANRELIPKNIAKSLPAAKRNFKSRRLPFKRDDLGKLFPYLQDPRLQTVLILGSHGLRIGEILGATFEKIKGNTLVVDRQFAPAINPGCDTPKTIHALCELKHQGHLRDIHLSDAEMSILLQSVEAAKTCRVFDDVLKKWVKVTFIVPNAKGAGWAYNDFRLKWKDAITEAGLPINPHDLRRVFSSRSHADRTLSQAAICEALGHRDFSTTVSYIFAEDEEVQAVHDAASDWIMGVIDSSDQLRNDQPECENLTSCKKLAQEPKVALRSMFSS